jgi:CubicO group peptidase (beta-lactamase class C family)
MLRRRWKPDDLVCEVILIAALFAAGVAPASAAEPTASRIDAAVLLQFPAHPHTGMSVSIVHHGQVVYSKGYGYRDDGTPDRFIPKDQNYYGMPFARPASGRVKADARTIYQIGSVTKQFTAAAILLLAERHELALDDALGKYAPEFSDPKLTLRALLTQRSGLPDFNTLGFLQRVLPLAKRRDGSFDNRRISRELAALPRHFAPGVRYEYSNSNYFVLGTVIERVGRQPLGEFLTANIFRPLGMNRTAFATTAATDDVAIGYRVDESGAIRRAYPWNIAWLGGAGAMTSTVEDLARWNAALEAHRILQAGSVAQMWHGLDAGRGQGLYAMGWIVDALGSHRYLWHNGQVGGFHALNVIFPDDDLAFTILANNQDARPEFLLPGIASLYVTVSGLDSVFPRSGIVLIEASAAVGLGAMAIAIVAIFTLKRFVAAGALAVLLALVAGFMLSIVIGFAFAGIVALLPTGAYILAAQFIPKRTLPPKKLRAGS